MDLVLSGLVFEMFDDGSRAEVPRPIDLHEQMLARKRDAAFHLIKMNSYWFFGLHGCAFLVPWTWEVWGDPEDVWKFELLLATFLGTLTMSAILAFCQLVIALRNTLVLRWWMIALGVLPWMIVATEAVLVFYVVTRFL